MTHSSTDLQAAKMTADAVSVGTAGPKSVEIAIDRGGTFTDVWAKVPGQPDIVLKLLSVNPDAYDDAPAEGQSSGSLAERNSVR